MRPIHTPVLLAAACVLGAAPARAQGFTPITVGQTVNGTLGAGDPTLTDRGPLKAYQFRAARGARFVASMRSADFDAYLTVARTVAGLTDYLKADDDSGGGANGTDARLRFTAPDDGTYILVAQSLGTDGAGSYTLSLEAAPATTTAQRGEIGAGQSVSGALAETDAVNDADDSFYDEYLLRAAAGERLSIELASDAFDALLSVGADEDGEFTAITSDDDSGGGTNSRVTFTVPVDAQILVRASALGAGTGAYTLRAAARPPRRTQATPQPISAGQDVRGELTEDDAQLEDESYFDYWTYTGRAGERIRVRMQSDAFDTFLAVGRLTGGTFEELSTNDDDGETTNSLIEFTVPADGTLIIRTNSLTGETLGAYTVRVDRVE